jgi:hypothetical protein
MNDVITIIIKKGLDCRIPGTPYRISMGYYRNDCISIIVGHAYFVRKGVPSGDLCSCSKKTCPAKSKIKVGSMYSS